MEEVKQNQKQLCCPVCKLRFNKEKRVPIFMLCCKQTACENCVAKMCKATKLEEGKIPEGKFECSLCSEKVYAPKGQDKNLSIFINEIVLEQIN